MRAGRLNKRVAIQYKSTQTTSDYGEDADTWAELVTCWAAVKPLSANESVTTDQNTARRSHEITIRSDAAPTVDENMRVSWDSRLFYITGVRNWEERGIYTVLDCMEEPD